MQRQDLESSREIEAKQEIVLKAMRELGKLRHTLAFMNAFMKPTAYIGLRAGTRLTTATFKCDKRQHQGVIESSWLVYLAVNEAFQQHNQRLAEHGGGMMVIMMTTTQLEGQTSSLNLIDSSRRI